MIMKERIADPAQRKKLGNLLTFATSMSISFQAFQSADMSWFRHCSLRILPLEHRRAPLLNSYGMETLDWFTLGCFSRASRILASFDCDINLHIHGRNRVLDLSGG